MIPYAVAKAVTGRSETLRKHPIAREMAANKALVDPAP
jgi:hypothetical protein